LPPYIRGIAKPVHHLRVASTKHHDRLARRKAEISGFLVDAVNKHDSALWLLQRSNGTWHMYLDHLAMYRKELEGRCLGRGVSLTSSKIRLIVLTVSPWTCEISYAMLTQTHLYSCRSCDEGPQGAARNPTSQHHSLRGVLLCCGPQTYSEDEETGREGMPFLESVRTVSLQFLQRRGWFCLEIEIVFHSSLDSFSIICYSDALIRHFRIS
jgi:hypothetical protein